MQGSKIVYFAPGITYNEALIRYGLTVNITELITNTRQFSCRPPRAFRQGEHRPHGSALNPCTARELFLHEIKLSIIIDYKLSLAMWQSAPGSDTRKGTSSSFVHRALTANSDAMMVPNVRVCVCMHVCIRELQWELGRNKTRKTTTQRKHQPEAAKKWEKLLRRTHS